LIAPRRRVKVKGLTFVQMPPGLLRTSLRFLTWTCVVLLAVLSLVPREEIETVRTDLPGQVEHIIAYVGASAVGMAGMD
jgi:hypothetical protein